MQISYKECDFCGKKIDGRTTGYYCFRLSEYFPRMTGNQKIEDPPISNVDLCSDCFNRIRKLKVNMVV